jgi:hypothetical protein
MVWNPFLNRDHGIAVTSRSAERCWIADITNVKQSATLGNAQPAP